MTSRRTSSQKSRTHCACSPTGNSRCCFTFSSPSIPARRLSVLTTSSHISSPSNRQLYISYHHSTRKGRMKKADSRFEIGWFEAILRSKFPEASCFLMLPGVLYRFPITQRSADSFTMTRLASLRDMTTSMAACRPRSFGIRFDSPRPTPARKHPTDRPYRHTARRSGRWTAISVYSPAQRWVCSLCIVSLQPQKLLPGVLVHRFAL